MATTGTIKVSPEKLIATADEFGEEGLVMSGIVNQMFNVVSSMSSTWEGEASAAYINRFRSLEADIQVLNRMIQEHVADLEQMANLYISAERTNSDDASSLAAGIIS